MTVLGGLKRTSKGTCRTRLSNGDISGGKNVIVFVVEPGTTVIPLCLPEEIGGLLAVAMFPALLEVREPGWWWWWNSDEGAIGAVGAT
jgi:hypothetical protein